MSKIDPKTLSGTAIIAPLLNVASFEQMTVHLNPIDRKGMNGGYPGNANGTQTERVVALVAEQIVKPSDVIVDLHGGDIDEDLRPYSYWTRTGNTAQDELSHKLVLAFGLDHVILRDVDASNPAAARSLGGYTLAQGKTMIVAEAGRSGLVLPADVDALVSGCLNVLGSLGMITRTVKPVAKPVFVEGGKRVQAHGGGMFFATAKRDTIVKEGEVIGYTTDYVGRRTGDVKAPATGLVTFIRPVPSMWQGRDARERVARHREGAAVSEAVTIGTDASAVTSSAPHSFATGVSIAPSPLTLNSATAWGELCGVYPK